MIKNCPICGHHLIQKKPLKAKCAFVFEKLPYLKCPRCGWTQSRIL